MADEGNELIAEDSKEKEGKTMDSPKTGKIWVQLIPGLPRGRSYDVAREEEQKKGKCRKSVRRTRDRRTSRGTT